MKIVVLGGGISTERHVSLVSATSVCRALRSLGHQAVFVDMFLGLEDYEKPLEQIFDEPDGLCGNAAIGHEAPDLEAVEASRKLRSKSRLGRKVLEVCQLADCVFLGLHGADGEDGKIQGTLDLLGVPYTGSDTLGSSMAMDKSTTKKIMTFVGVPTPHWHCFSMDRDSVKTAVEHTDLPCVVKVVNGGSSIGVYICDTQEQLEDALVKCRENGSRIIIEDKITGREFTVPVFGGKALNAIEIIPPESGKFDYVSKYQSGAEGAREVCPADITPEQQTLLGSLALRLHNALGLSVYSRTDFILDSDGQAWCLEVNTLPGMTPNSLIPKAAKLEGLDYAHLCEKIVLLSMNRQR